MTILVTGASGQLGRLVVAALLERGVPASDIRAGARTPSAIADLGVPTVELDYDRPETVAAAFADADTVLLISASEPGRRFPQHKAVIDAAVQAGVEKFVYTSAPKATTFEWPLGAEHALTEQAIADSGLPAVVLRNNWYTENYAGDVARAKETGTIAASVGDGQVASASRADYAAAAAAVLTEDEHIGEVYELAGDTVWTYDDLAAATAEVLGRDVAYVRLTPAEHIAALEAAGLDAGVAGFVQSIDAGISGGVLADSDGTLARLIGRPTTPLVDGLRAATA